MNQCDKVFGFNYNVIYRAYIAKLKVIEHIHILCAISGGSDSDIMLDMLHEVDPDKKIDYIFYDTGLEYAATKRHLNYLETRYDIKIIRERSKKPIPICCKEYGVPFLSKRISEYISRLQRKNFQWEDKSFEELSQKYPKCQSALKWWCNCYKDGSNFNINKNYALKEFLIAHPPTFKISDKCCYYNKKSLAQNMIEVGRYDLNCIGVRKAEGGLRATSYKNCFTLYYDRNCNDFTPLFFLSNKDKEEYKNYRGIKYSNPQDEVVSVADRVRADKRGVEEHRLRP